MPSRLCRLLLAQTLVVASLSAGCTKAVCLKQHTEPRPGYLVIKQFGPWRWQGWYEPLSNVVTVCDQWQEVK